MAPFLIMNGRILVDVPQTGHKAGEYADIDPIMAKALVEMGAFDPEAPWGGDEEPPAKRTVTRKSKTQ